MSSKRQTDQDFEDLFGEPAPKMIKKEVTQMQEARYSFNIKFNLQGFEAQFTIRSDENSGTVVSEAQNFLALLTKWGGQPGTWAKGNGQPSNGKAKDGQAIVLCAQCKVEGVAVGGTSQKNGKAYHALKCPRCQEFIKGSFRWAA